MTLSSFSPSKGTSNLLDKKGGNGDQNLCPPFANSLMRKAETIFNFSFLYCFLFPHWPLSIFSSTQNYFAITNHFILFLDT